MKLLVKCSAWFILALPGGVIGAADIDWRHWELAAAALDGHHRAIQEIARLIDD